MSYQNLPPPVLVKDPSFDRWINLLYNSVNSISNPANPVFPITGTSFPASVSPYQNSTGSALDIVVIGGTVTLIEFSRSYNSGGTVTWYPLGITSGTIRLSISDSMRITYSVAPTLYGIPR